MSEPFSAPRPHSGPGAVLVIGGANLDVKCHLRAPVVLGTSNPGATSTAPGGVARNIAENLGRLGAPVRLVAAVGRDAAGEALLAATRAAGVDTAPCLRVPGPSGTYTAVLNPDGELVLGVAAMDATDALTPETIEARRGEIEAARLVVVDCNVAAATLARVAAIARGAGVPCLVEPVSVPKAARLREVLLAGTPVHTVTPNRDELAALAGRPLDGGPIDGETEHDASLAAAADDLHALGVEVVWVRLGAAGSLLSGPNGRARLPARSARVLDVTGAGDAMLAGYVSALLGGADPPEAARVGHALAALTVESPHTVVPDLTPARLAARLQGTP